jgi:hypothetical protein
MNLDITSWTQVEESVRDFIEDSLEDYSLDHDVLIGEVTYPIPSLDECKMVAVNIAGDMGEQAIFTNPGTQSSCFNFRGQFEGIYSNRSDAQELYVVLKNVLPAKESGSDLENVINLAIDTPNLVRVVLDVDNGEAEGGQQRYWAITIPFTINFKGFENSESV